MNEDICKQIEEIILKKQGKKVAVLYGEVPELGNWFYIRRKLYDGYYRLGIVSNSAVSYVNRILNTLPDDVIIIK